MGEDVSTDLPKVKKVKLPSNGKKNEKTAKPKAKTEAKKSDASSTKVAAKSKPKTVKADKSEKPATKPAKGKSKPVAKEAKAPAKGKAAKPATKGKAPAKASNGAITADAVAARISKVVATGKAETVKSVDYASGKSVVDGLVAKASAILLRAYSDKAVSSITHGDAKIAKAAKELLAKNAASVRAEAVAAHAKKMATSIAKAAKSADAGKLTATEYRAVAFEV